MTTKTITVLIADDSALMRREIRRMLESADDVVVVGAARDGAEALQMCKDLDPDVVTLDINMPNMDGLTALQHIMIEHPKPVIMLSSLTQDGAATSFEALELGAIDFVAKPGGTVSTNIENVQSELLSKVRQAAGGRTLTASASARRRRKQQTEARTRATSAQASSLRTATASPKNCQFVVLIGQSTGGPNTILEVLPAIPKDFPAAIMIVQHMPGNFTPSFADRLSRHCAIPFKEVKSGDLLEAGKGYLAPGDLHTILAPGLKGSNQVYLRTSKLPADTLHTPSVDVTMESFLNYFPAKNLVGVILTGMGDDGARTLCKIRELGGRTVAESEETAIVFGMPKEAIRLGGAEFVLPADRIGQKIVELIEEITRYEERNRAV